jgi:hypothetical protein
VRDAIASSPLNYLLRDEESPGFEISRNRPM